MVVTSPRSHAANVSKLFVGNQSFNARLYVNRLGLSVGTVFSSDIHGFLRKKEWSIL
jgi:hypothetical protein